MRTTRSIAARPNILPLADLRAQMNRLLEDFGRDMEWKPLFGDNRMLFSPTVDAVETEKALRVTAELPGLDEKDIHVELTRDSLILKGEKSEETEEEGDNFHRKERRFGSFERVIALPWEVDPAEVESEASFKKGVLTVSVPKPEDLPAATKRVSITSN
jgi:HSP20 family protein